MTYNSFWYKHGLNVVTVFVVLFMVFGTIGGCMYENNKAQKKRDYLNSEQCVLLSKEQTGQSRKIGKMSRKYETIYTYNCATGKKLVVEWN